MIFLLPAAALEDYLKHNSNQDDQEMEVFSQARDTERGNDTVATEDAEVRSDSKQPKSAIGFMTTQGPVSLDGSFPSESLPSPSRTGGGGGGGGGEGEQEEWCSGHVCLRLRPDGLKEKYASGREIGDAKLSEDDSGTDGNSSSEEGGDRQVRMASDGI